MHHDFLGNPIPDNAKVIVTLAFSAYSQSLDIGTVIRSTPKSLVVQRSRASKPNYYKPADVIVLTDEDYIMYKLRTDNA